VQRPTPNEGIKQRDAAKLANEVGRSFAEALLDYKNQKVKKLIQATHPYQLPEIIGIPITQSSSEYLKWLLNVVK